MECQSVQMYSGKILDGKLIGAYVEMIIDDLSRNNLSCAEAREILKAALSVIDEYSVLKGASLKSHSE